MFFAAVFLQTVCLRGIQLVLHEKKNHERPQAEANMRFIEKYDAAFLGKIPRKR